MWILDLIARIRQFIPIQSTWRFVFVCAIIGAILLGFVGWLADNEYRFKSRQNQPTQSASPEPTKSGNATTVGSQSPAVIGENNKITYDKPAESKKEESKPPK